MNAMERALDETNAWLDEILNETGTLDRHRAFLGLKAVLQAWRDRLEAGEAVRVAEELPMILRGYYFEGWHAVQPPAVDHGREDFLKRVAGYIPSFVAIDPEEISRAVFALIGKHMHRGELGDLRDLLPREFRAEWMPHSKTGVPNRHATRPISVCPYCGRKLKERNLCPECDGSPD